MTSIALVGPGRHGTAIAQLFASHGVDIDLYHHRPAKAELAARTVRESARDAEVRVASSLAEAVSRNELVVLTTLWDAPQRAVLGELGDLMRDRALLDVSNPLDVTPAGIIPRRPLQGSAGQFVATLLPDGAGHAKAFSNLGTAMIASGADLTPPAVLPFLADSSATAELVRPYLARTGWRPWLAGGISRSRELEIGGRFNVASGRYGRARLEEREFLALDGAEAKLVD